MLPARLVLVVLLVLATHPFSMPGEKGSASVQEWVKSQESADTSGTTYLLFTLAGKFIRLPKSETANPPNLAVECKLSKRSGESNGKFSSGSLQVGIPLRIDWVEPEVIHGIGYYPKISVRVRLDDGKALQGLWVPGTDKTSDSFQKNILKKILRAHTILITTHEKSGEEVAVQFDMPDPSQIAKACGVAGHEK